MDKSLERGIDMENKLKKLDISYSKIIGVDGYNMNSNENCKRILFPIPDKLGMKLECLHYNQEWIYDGTIETSFPGLHLYSQWGTKGITISNLIAFEESLKIDKEWICILEDDAEIDEKCLNRILEFINNKSNNIYDMILLDERWGGFGGACGVIYNKRKMNQFIEDLHPLSQFSIVNEKICECLMLDHFINYSGGNLKLWDQNTWDWKLYKYIKYANIQYYQLNIIPSGKYPTTQ